jgi:hypothetical protein
MRVHLWLVLVSVFLVATVSEGAPPEPAPVVDGTRPADIAATAPVPVLVYSTVVDLGADDQRLALAVANEALATASVSIVWTVCTPGSCLSPVPAALKIRIVQSPADSGASAHLLGHALIDPQTQSGELATVFVDRTQRLASELGIDDRVLLGRTIAHELGHLLMGTATHAGAGLMREVWLRDELVGTRPNDWAFDALDAAAIRDRLARLRGGRPRGSS